jgi:hypothetical protein
MKSPFIPAFLATILSLPPLARAQTQAAPPPKEKYESFAMTHGGDPSRGRALFNDPKRLACSPDQGFRQRTSTL